MGAKDHFPLLSPGAKPISNGSLLPDREFSALLNATGSPPVAVRPASASHRHCLVSPPPPAAPAPAHNSAARLRRAHTGPPRTTSAWVSPFSTDVHKEGTSSPTPCCGDETRFGTSLGTRSDPRSDPRPALRSACYLLVGIRRRSRSAFCVPGSATPAF